MLLKIADKQAQYLVRIFNYLINAIKIKAAILTFHLVIISCLCPIHKARRLGDNSRDLQQINLVLLSMKCFKSSYD